MIVNRDQMWVILTPPKTASTTLSALFSEAPFRLEKDPDQHRIAPPQDMRVILTVRNPWTRVVSLWRHYLGEVRKSLPTLKSYSFERFLQDVDADCHTPFFSYSISQWVKSIDHIDAVVHFETLEADLRLALPAYDWGNIKVPHINRNPILTDTHPLRKARWGRPVAILPDPLADPAIQQKVIDLNRDDFTRFGYSTVYGCA